MKNTILSFFSFCAFALLTQTIHAQGISAADQKGVDACYNGFMAAFEKLDATNLGALLTENAEHITPDGNITRGRANVVAMMAGFMEFLKSQPKPDKATIKNVSSQGRYLADNIVLWTYTEENTMQFGSETKVEKTTTAVVLKKVNGQWLADLIALTPVVQMPPMGK